MICPAYFSTQTRPNSGSFSRDHGILQYPANDLNFSSYSSKSVEPNRRRWRFYFTNALVPVLCATGQIPCFPGIPIGQSHPPSLIHRHIVNGTEPAAAGYACKAGGDDE